MFTIDAHTADVRVRIDSQSLDELFRDAAASLMDVLGASEDGARNITRRVEIESPDRTSLLVDFLNELLGLALVHGEMYSGMRFELLSETSLVADVSGGRARISEEVKAVTYHEADVQERPDGRWTTSLIFDL